MQYFGIPTCPYCKKRVNLIRTWSLKKQGEFQCPRCGGISNIYLSPLIYVLALFALFAGGAVYFFHKFVLDDISLETALQVFLPFAGFFLLSVFFVYLAKPVIKKVSREDMQKKRFGRKAAPPGPVSQNVYYDREDYTPEPPPPPPPAPEPVVRVQQAAPAARPIQKRPAPPAPPAPTARQQGTAVIRPPVPVNRRPIRPAAPPPAEPVKITSHAEPPQPADDFFAKYDDPDYVQRRLREINGSSK